MPEIALPCPRCQTSLLVDEENAGLEVLCPGCGGHLVLPADLSGRTPVVVKDGGVTLPGPEAVGAGEAAAGDAGSRRHFRLSRTGQAPAVEGGAAAPAESTAGRGGHLPQRRGVTAEEEMRRLAAIVAEPVAYDLHKVDTRGRTAFPCPVCHRPVWVTKSDAGAALHCDGCGADVRAPDPATGAPAAVLGGVESPAQRAKTVLPARRQVEDLAMGEQAAAGRPKRQEDKLPPARHATPEPAPQAEVRARMPAGPVEPIPARGDVSLAPSLPVLPAVRQRDIIPAAPAPTVTAPAAPTEPKAPLPEPKGRGPRMAPERAPAFSPKHEADLSPEEVGQWGGGDQPAEHSPAFRRAVSIAVALLVVALVGVGTMMVKGMFSAPPPAAAEEGEKAEENPTASVDAARETLTKFFGADTIDAMAQQVRHPGETADRLRRHYASRPLAPRKVEFTTDWREVDDYEGSGVSFILTTVQVDAFKRLEVALELPRGGGAPKLDWEHAFAWSDVPWMDFLTKGHDAPAEFRVTASPVDHYLGAYQDKFRYMAFRLADPENSLNCYGYCEVDSEPARLLLAECQQARRRGEVNQEGEGVARCIVRLRPVAEGKRFNQFAIDAFVWKSWLRP